MIMTILCRGIDILLHLWPWSIEFNFILSEKTHKLSLSQLNLILYIYKKITLVNFIKAHPLITIKYSINLHTYTYSIN